MDHIYFLIMAGGEGTRFQPLSTPAKPKQFINIVGEKSLIRQTFDRFKTFKYFKGNSYVYVATNARYIDLVRHELPEVPIANIIGETRKKNTAPCIGFVSQLIYNKDPEAIIVCLPSDHVILNQAEFLSVLESAIQLAGKEQKLVTLGINPTGPNTQYGYIERSNLQTKGLLHNAFVIKRFVEKPNEDTAQSYVSSGKFYWNSGMFVWMAKVILEEIANHIPELSGELGHIPRKVDMACMVNFFERAPSISIDYGVMEKSKNVMVIPCEFGWSDVGTWKSLKELSDSGAVTISPEVKSVMEKHIA
jgi:mannose-1-phosphate guanylyltransferase